MKGKKRARGGVIGKEREPTSQGLSPWHPSSSIGTLMVSCSWPQQAVIQPSLGLAFQGIQMCWRWSLLRVPELASTELTWVPRLPHHSHFLACPWETFSLVWRLQSVEAFSAASDACLLRSIGQCQAATHSLENSIPQYCKPGIMCTTGQEPASLSTDSTFCFRKSKGSAASLCSLLPPLPSPPHPFSSGLRPPSFTGACTLHGLVPGMQAPESSARPRWWANKAFKALEECFQLEFTWLGLCSFCFQVSSLEAVARTPSQPRTQREAWSWCQQRET